MIRSDRWLKKQFPRQAEEGLVNPASLDVRLGGQIICKNNHNSETGKYQNSQGITQERI